jgi:hypothetical protein
MFKKIPIANRGDKGNKAVAARPDCMARAERTGDFHAEADRV